MIQTKSTLKEQREILKSGTTTIKHLLKTCTAKTTPYFINMHWECRTKTTNIQYKKKFRSIQTLRKSWCCVSKKNLRLINNLIQKIIEQTFGTNFQMPSPKQVFVVLSPSPAKILGSATVTECFNCIDYFFQPLT